MTILLTPKANGSWSIHRCHITLFRDLQLGRSIKLECELARDEHLRFGGDVHVGMPGPFPTLALTNHAKDTRVSRPERHEYGALAA